MADRKISRRGIFNRFRKLSRTNNSRQLRSAVLEAMESRVMLSTSTLTAYMAVPSNNNAYHYDVLAIQNGTSTDISGDIVGTPGMQSGLTAPTLNLVTTDANTATLYWSWVTDATNYQVAYSTGSSYTFSSVGNVNYVTIPALTNGTTYNFEVEACNSVATSAASAPVSATPNPIIMDGSFETIRAPIDWYTTSDLSGSAWNFGDGSGVEANGVQDGTQGYIPDAPDGTQCAYLVSPDPETDNTAGSISQDVTLGAGTYTLSYSTVSNDSIPITVNFNGSQIDEVTPASSWGGASDQITVTTPGSYNITFGVDTSSGDHPDDNQTYAYIDAVSLYQNNFTAPPAGVVASSVSGKVLLAFPADSSADSYEILSGASAGSYNNSALFPNINTTNVFAAAGQTFAGPLATVTNPSGINLSNYTTLVDWGSGQNNNQGSLNTTTGVFSGTNTYSIPISTYDLVGLQDGAGQGGPHNQLYASAQVTVTPVLPAPSSPMPYDITHSLAGAAPSGFNTFYNPPVSTTATIPSNAPIIAVADSTGGPSTSFTVSGTNFTTQTGSSAFSDTRFIVYGQTGQSDATASEAVIQDINSNTAILTVDSSQPANAMYMVWPESKASSQGNVDALVGAPIMLNRTQTTWIATNPDLVNSDQTLSASAGGVVSVYGRSLSNNATSFIYLQPTSGTGQWITATNGSATTVNPYEVQFTLPSGLAAGTYDVWINNGLGGNYGWSHAPTQIKVTTASRWNTNTNTYNVVTVYHADPTGHTNAYAAISSALTDAGNNPGSTVFFPAGTYNITSSSPLALPANVHIQGASKSTTTLDFRQSISSGDLITSGNNLEINGLTLQYSAGDFSSSAYMLGVRFASNITIHDDIFRSNGIGGVDAQMANYVSIKNSDFYGNQAVGSAGTDTPGDTPHDFIITNDNFYTGYSSLWAISPSGYDIDISNCTYQDLNLNDTTNVGTTANPIIRGFSQGNFIVEQQLRLVPGYNQYIANNTTTKIGAPVGMTGNQGTQFLSEGPGDWAFGTENYSTSNTVTLAASAMNPRDDSGYTTNVFVAGMEVIVASGSGAGQFNTIASKVVNSDGSITFTMTNPWALKPTVGSDIDICNTISSTVFYQNTLQNAQSWETNSGGANIAGQNLGGTSGIDIFTGGYGLVMDSNTIDYLQTGISLWAANAHSNLHFIDIINNNIENSYSNGIYLAREATSDPNFIGVRVNNNTIGPSGTVYSGTYSEPNLYQVATPIGIHTSDESYQAHGGIAFASIENNSITVPSGQTGMDIYNDPDLLVDNNSFFAQGTSSSTKAILAGMQYSTTISPEAHLQQNSFSGFTSGNNVNVGTNTFTNFAVVPNQIIFVSFLNPQSMQITLPLLNDGLTSQSWSISSNASWLTFQSSSGSTSAQSSTGSPIMNIDPTGVGYDQLGEATLTLTYGGQTYSIKIYLGHPRTGLTN
jgi:hypothetical protein